MTLCVHAESSLCTSVVTVGSQYRCSIIYFHLGEDETIGDTERTSAEEMEDNLSVESVGDKSDLLQNDKDLEVHVYICM